MGFTKKEIDYLVNYINQTIQGLSEQQLRYLLEGKIELGVVYKEKWVDEPHNIFNEIIDSISNAKDRNEAIDILEQMNFLKKDLIDLSEYLQIHLNRSNNKEQIIEKIIEATFGVTSKSKAIKGLDLKRK